MLLRNAGLVPDAKATSTARLHAEPGHGADPPAGEPEVDEGTTVALHLVRRPGTGERAAAGRPAAGRRRGRSSRASTSMPKIEPVDSEKPPGTVVERRPGRPARRWPRARRSRSGLEGQPEGRCRTWPNKGYTEETAKAVLTSRPASTSARSRCSRRAPTDAGPGGQGDLPGSGRRGTPAKTQPPSTITHHRSPRLRRRRRRHGSPSSRQPDLRDVASDSCTPTGPSHRGAGDATGGVARAVRRRRRCGGPRPRRRARGPGPARPGSRSAASQFASIRWPPWVSTDSGWNCTPSSGRVRWRIAMTSAGVGGPPGHLDLVRAASTRPRPASGTGWR